MLGVNDPDKWKKQSKEHIWKVFKQFFQSLLPNKQNGGIMKGQAFSTQL